MVFGPQNVPTMAQFGCQLGGQKDAKGPETPTSTHEKMKFFILEILYRTKGTTQMAFAKPRAK